ncbi:uncharacterized protein ACHE_60097A [Aspergillus chevalieri]|uniref:AMP-dependent synthetase/ligase domain-containing protein n=1 Tax=Aspergillus chevalieri TaxID=182096 RepID=A0A7R7VT14_ASPCH|nr:uncharacterized protein ACHE_60097A [Aspergillus chevalieri]BCR90211.1 hypothetical protein ACHE_60097A [Aspergillus chevalieri]
MLFSFSITNLLFSICILMNVKMIFEPAERLHIPTKDLLSYIFDNPEYDQDEPIYRDPANSSRSISCNQARKLIRQLVAGLQAWGVRKGDCIAIHAFNDIYYSMLVLAIVGAGGIFTGTNPSYTPMELEHPFKESYDKNESETGSLGS